MQKVFLLITFLFLLSFSQNVKAGDLIKSITVENGFYIEYADKISNDRYLMVLYGSGEVEGILFDKNFEILWRQSVELQRIRAARTRLAILHDDEHVYFLNKGTSDSGNSMEITRITNEGRAVKREIDLALNGTFCGHFIHDGNIYLLQNRRRDYELNIINTNNFQSSSRKLDLPELSGGEWKIEYTDGDVMFLHVGNMSRTNRSLEELQIRLIAIDVYGNSEYDVRLSVPLLPNMKTFSHVYHYQIDRTRYIGPYYRLAFANQGNTIYLMGIRNNVNASTNQSNGYFIKKINLLQDSYETEWVINDNFAFRDENNASMGIYGDIHYYLNEEEDIFIFSYFRPSLALRDISLLGYEILNSSGDRIFTTNRDKELFNSRMMTRNRFNIMGSIEKSLWRRQFHYALKRVMSDNPSTPWLQKHYDLVKKNAENDNISNNVIIGYIVGKDDVHLIEENSQDNTVNIYKSKRRF